MKPTVYRFSPVCVSQVTVTTWHEIEHAAAKVDVDPHDVLHVYVEKMRKRWTPDQCAARVLNLSEQAQRRFAHGTGATR